MSNDPNLEQFEQGLATVCDELVSGANTVVLDAMAPPASAEEHEARARWCAHVENVIASLVRANAKLTATIPVLRKAHARVAKRNRRGDAA